MAPTFRLLLALGWLLALGCGTSNMAPVTGKVVFPDGTRLTTGNVIFNPQEQSRYGAQGLIGADGTFRMGTHKAGDGAHLGKYRVSIEMPYHARPDASGKMVEPKRLIDPRFEDPATSGVEFTVMSGANDLTITVMKPGKTK